MLRVALPVLLLALVGCGVNPEGQLEKARELLSEGSYAEASAAANAGLAAGATGPVAWRLELAALEGEARDGKTADVLSRLETLGGAWKDQLNGALYVQTAGQVKEAGDATGAISVLDAGAKRFPADADIAQAISQTREKGGTAEQERLRSLGYVE